MLRNLRLGIRRRAVTIFLFTYGLVIGTSAPLLLARCASSGSCGNCGAICGVGLGILPLVLFIAVKTRIRHLGLNLLPLFVRERSRNGCRENHHEKNIHHHPEQ